MINIGFDYEAMSKAEIETVIDLIQSHIENLLSDIKSLINVDDIGIQISTCSKEKKFVITSNNFTDKNYVKSIEQDLAQLDTIRNLMQIVQEVKND